IEQAHERMFVEFFGLGFTKHSRKRHHQSVWNSLLWEFDFFGAAAIGGG
ncbi:MAG: hypothetical protein RIS50_1027, partial [Bacteroidota bacterium]